MLEGQAGIEPALGSYPYLHAKPRFRADRGCRTQQLAVLLVGETGIEPATSGSQSQRSTKLSYTPREALFPIHCNYTTLLGACQAPNAFLFYGQEGGGEEPKATTYL